MAQSAAIEILIKERDRLKSEQSAAFHQMQDAINEIEASIDSLSGKTVWETPTTTYYDDAHAGYIKNTEDGI